VRWVSPAGAPRDGDRVLRARLDGLLLGVQQLAGEAMTPLQATLLGYVLMLAVICLLFRGAK
jgi:hypothetical protein